MTVESNYTTNYSLSLSYWYTGWTHRSSTVKYSLLLRGNGCEAAAGLKRCLNSIRINRRSIRLWTSGFMPGCWRVQFPSWFSWWKRPPEIHSTSEVLCKIMSEICKYKMKCEYREQSFNLCSNIGTLVHAEASKCIFHPNCRMWEGENFIKKGSGVCNRRQMITLRTLIETASPKVKQRLFECNTVYVRSEMHRHITQYWLLVQYEPKTDGRNLKLQSDLKY